MKRILLILFLFAFIIYSSFLVLAIECKDSDGLNYYNKGYIQGAWPGQTNSEVEYDSCCTNCTGQRKNVQTSDNLIEFYCNNSEIAFEVKQCENGCAGGFCLQSCSEQGGQVCDVPGNCKGTRVWSNDFEDNCCVGGCNIVNNSLPGEGKVKILPEVASQKAKQRLGELGFNITLKEVGSGNNTKQYYEAEGEKEGKMLGLFKVKGKVSAEVDAETGEVVKVRKPWWAFLASGI